MTPVKGRRLFTVILTGLSGSGKTVALNAFEDSGFFCVDNLPTTLIESFIDLCSRTPSISKVAIGVDIRERRFFKDFSNIISALRRSQRVEIIFLEAKDEVIIKRFKETRRPHPLGYKNLKEALHKEAEELSSIRDEADRIIDTSTLSPHQLRRLITRPYLGEKTDKLNITLVSFGYKYGIPPEVDLLFDVRFLPNPNFIDRLKALPGTSMKVKRFVITQKETKHFFDKLYPLLDHLIPLYMDEGRSYLTIGIGCTGGRHRSPAIVEEMKKRFDRKRFNVSVVHRDLQ